ncbi:MAG: PEP/pyruvate-binding domain-containing protein [Anaerolineales bacterium]|nr:PEP/pyruvate-binding domain-containing protein [Anaerolineales bacterium]
MTLPSSDRILNIYLTLNQYPILSGRIRARMRRELFKRGIISSEKFETEVRQKAIQSQEREGVHDPDNQETTDVWELRLQRITASLTDFYFAYNLPYEEFEHIIREVLSERGSDDTDFVWFNPELAPHDMLFEQAENIESMPLDKRVLYDARIQEIKAVLLRTMVSDQLSYLKLARQWFTIDDLKEIRKRKIGNGKIGGKAAGMLLAMRILRENLPEELRGKFEIPTSYFLGSDVFYSFMSMNGLMHWNDQKYKSEEEMRSDFPKIRLEFSKGQFPPEIIDRLREVIEEAGNRPLIVRSSSLLEDNFGTSFAGMYESIFCPNQGQSEQNLFELIQAIITVYSSATNPNVLLYRRHKGLIDYDERIAILIQFVEGERFNKYYLPHGAGVAFSRNLYRWSPQIRKEDGFLRLVWGFGTRAVDSTGNDYPRLVALSHPDLHPAAEVKAIRRYSQHLVDLIDLEENTFKTVALQEIINPHYSPIRYIAQVDQDGYLAPIRTNRVDKDSMVVTFDQLLKRTDFADSMRIMLDLLETHYEAPVDTEFTIHIANPQETKPEIRISILQCRPQSQLQAAEEARFPEDLDEKDIILSTRRMVPQGVVPEINYVLFVPPEDYFSLASQAERNKLEKAIGNLNGALDGQLYIAVGPGRWGTSSPDLGIHIGYADIYNTRALIELSGSGIGSAPEASFGTHFFQDLIEANIYPLAVYLDDDDAIFNQSFFYQSPNCLGDWIKADDALLKTLRLIDVNAFRPNHHLKLIMDDDQAKAAIFLVPNN